MLDPKPMLGIGFLVQAPHRTARHVQPGYE